MNVYTLVWKNKRPPNGIIVHIVMNVYHMGGEQQKVRYEMNVKYAMNQERKIMGYGNSQLGTIWIHFQMDTHTTYRS